MDFLEQSVQQLSPEERNEFKQFLQKQRLERRDLKLFDLLCSAEKLKPRAIAGALYEPLNMNAYHSLRKRLMAQLFTFIVSKRLAEDTSMASGVMGMISMAQFMLEKRADSAAAHFLQRAEEIALKSQQFDLLSNVYNIRITNADILEEDVDHLIVKWQANNKRLIARQKLDMAYALIRKNLAIARRAGTTLDPEAIINAVFRDFEITTDEASDPAFMYRVVALTRSAYVSSKDYKRLEPFAVQIYSRLKKSDSFSKTDFTWELGFLFMISHVLYRNRKFSEASLWLNEMENLMPNKVFRLSAYYPKYIAMRAAIASFSGQNSEAIEMMKGALQNRLVKGQLTERLNIQLNLAVYYFQATEYRKAIKTIIEIGHSDRWLEEKKGKEWRFKKNMIEMIIQFELGNEDVAMSMIKSMDSYFSGFLSHPVYQRARVFLNFIRRLIDTPEVITTPEFAEEVKAARMGWPGDREDIQAITFFCWLKSKMLRREYYPVLLEVMSRE